MTADRTYGAGDGPNLESCPSGDLLSAYMDGEVKQRVREDITSHLSRCQRCRHAYGVLDRVQKHVLELPVGHPPPSIRYGLASRLDRHLEKTRFWYSAFDWRWILGRPTRRRLAIGFAVLFFLPIVLFQVQHRWERQRVLRDVDRFGSGIVSRDAVNPFDLDARIVPIEEGNPFQPYVRSP